MTQTDGDTKPGFWARLRLAVFGEPSEPPDYEAMWAEYEPQLAAYRATTWKPLRGAARPGSRSHFGGTPLLEPGERWPVCGKCKRPMPLLLQLDSRELPGEATGAFPDGLLQAFFCTKCFDWKPFRDRMLIRVLRPDAPLASTDEACADALRAVGIEGWEADTDYPQPGDMGLEDDAIDEEEWWEVLFENDYPRQGDKLLGCPYWVQDPDRPPCPRCAAPMPAIFQIDSNHGLDMMWGDAGVAHVFWCPAHADQLALTWQCY